MTLSRYLFLCILVLQCRVLTAQNVDFPNGASSVNIGDMDIPGNKITVEALIYLEKNTPFGNIVSKHRTPSNVNYLLRPMTFELTTYVQGNSGVTHFLQMFNPSTIAMNKWYHVAGTYDGARVKYYVDGCLVIDSAFSGNLYQNDFATAIGNQSTCECEQFSGKIDEVRIWNVCRTQQEIFSNMTTLPNPGTQTGLVGYYTFAGNYINLQGNATYDGVAKGSPAFSADTASIQPFALQSVNITNTDCLKSANGTITIIANRANATFSLDGKTYQTSNTFLHKPAGTYTVYVKIPEGCIISSTVTVANNNLFVQKNINATICEGSTFEGHSSSGVFTDTLHAMSSCDTLRILALTVNKKQHVTLNKMICYGDSLYGYKKTGTYTDTLKSSFGCDSIRVLNLVVNSKIFNSINIAICEGSSYAGYTKAGTYTDILKSSNGCDSTRVLNLSILPKVFSTVNQTICADSAYYGHTATGTYTDVYKSSLGCDSTRLLNLTVLPKPYSSLYQTICQGKNYEGHFISGTYTDHFTAVSGCDSTRDLILTVIPYAYSTISKSICEGDTFMGYNKAGIYRDTLKTAEDCDSVRIINLTVVRLPEPDLSKQNIICTGESLSLYPGAFATYLWQDGSKNDHLTIRNAGLYSVTVSNACGIKATSVQVKEQDCTPEFPNAFTPNADGRNDVFRIIRPYNLKDYHLTIFNRLGQKVFETKEPSAGWDGSTKGQRPENGQFVWTCQYTRNGIRSNLKGTVLLIMGVGKY